MTCRRLLVVLGACFLAAVNMPGADPKQPPAAQAGPLAPEESQKRFVLPAGLRIELVASEPDVQSPVAMAFDEKGRLYVVEMRDYPNGPEKGQPAEGRIVLLGADADSGGRFKKKAVFADQLLFANGVLPYNGGVIVTAAPHILFLKDTNGDGTADVTEKLYEGFATQNPQLRVSNPQLGLDGWIYVANGLRGGQIKRSGKEDAKPIDISGRDFRFDPRHDRAEAITGMGQYGNTFDDWGNRFVCTNRHQWVHLALPEHYIRRNPYLATPPPHKDNQGPGGAARVYPISRQVTTAAEHAGSFTAACGVHVYRGDLLPKEYRGAIFTCEPTGNLVHQEILLPKGSTFTGRAARQGVEFLASTDEWFRPVFLTTGPDGALYVIDMYRKVIEHPEFMPKDLKNRPDLAEGKERGRIWRIVPEYYESQPFEDPKLNEKKSMVLAALKLNDANPWIRTTTQRLLLTRGDRDCEGDLRHAIRSKPQDGDPPEIPFSDAQAGVLAAHILNYHQKLDPASVGRLLRHPHPRVREQGVRLAEQFLSKAPELRALVFKLADDPDARLRFQVAFSLGEWDDDRILAPLARIALANVDDAGSRTAVASSVPTRAGALLATLFDAGIIKQPGTDRLQLVQELAALVGARQDPTEVVHTLQNTLKLTGKDAAGWQMAVRKGLADGMQRRGTQLSAFVEKLPKDQRGLLEKMDKLMDGTVALARDGKGDTAERLEAVAMLAHLDWKTAGTVLGNLAAEDPTPAVRLAAVRALAAFPNPEVAGLLVKPWATYPPAGRAAAVEALLAQPERTLAFLTELEAGRVKPEELDPLRRVQLQNHRRSDIRDRAKKLFAGLATPERKKVIEDYKAALTMAGDVRRGQEVFKKATCVSCHRIGNLGADVGPSIADTRTKTLEQLLIDVLDPNAAIDANFVNYVVSLKDGRILTGLITGETASSITLKRGDNQGDTVLRQDLDTDGILSTGKSLMPEGLEKNFNVQELADLLAFLKGWRELEAKKE